VAKPFGEITKQKKIRKTNIGDNKKQRTKKVISR